MAREIKFTVGNNLRGYKTVEVVVLGGKVSYKILRNGLLNVDKKIFPTVKVSDSWLAELDALEIFSWEENYSSSTQNGLQWVLTFVDGNRIYHGRGANAYPENWLRFLDWLDALIPELEFVNRNRLECVTIDYSDERLILDRQEKTLTLDKRNSSHVYDVSADIKKIFDTCQKFFDEVDRRDADIDLGTRAKIELVRHDKRLEVFETLYSESFLPGLTNFIELIQTVADDLKADMFTPQSIVILPRQGKYILCKVQFKGSYKSYTYRTDDETFAVGDVVDVPVGRNNEVSQARIVEVGYFDECEAPFPIDRIKKIIGKHIADDWED